MDELAHNMWWAWNYEARDLWRSLDEDLYEEVEHNPVLLLERLSPLILLLPAAVYGTGYRTGKKIRTRIHTVISENDRKRVRKEKKRIRERNSPRIKGPEQLN